MFICDASFEIITNVSFQNGNNLVWCLFANETDRLIIDYSSALLLSFCQMVVHAKDLIESSEVSTGQDALGKLLLEDFVIIVMTFALFLLFRQL